MGEADNGYSGHTGRDRQKARTRRALVATLRELLAGGADPSVAAVAQAAGISRTTAYRYFPDQGSLLQAAIPETASTSLLPGDAAREPRARLVQTLEAHFEFLRRWEPQLRAALRASLLPGAGQPALRGGRAVAWYEDALAPLGARRPDLDTHDLAIRLRAVAGIEAYVWLTDVAALEPVRACDVMRSNALAVYEAALSQS